MRNKKRKQALSENVQIDNELIEYIQPQGGITFKEANDIICGDGYIRILHIYQLPKSLDDFWMDRIFSIDGVISSVDIHTRNISEVKKNINKSLKEEFSREHHARDYMELYDAKQRQMQLTQMLDELNSFGEVVKMVDFRIFIRSRNRYELDQITEDIMASLEGDTYMSATLLNEGKREWQSLFEPYSTQHNKIFALKAHPLMTEQLAFGYPFDYSELVDEYGTLLGFTPIGGIVLFDEFTKTETRQYYNSLAAGAMGSGKSTFLKKRFKANAAAGNFVRTFDVSGEFADLTREFGGKIIKCNGTAGILNPLEILKAGDDDFASYTRHISKVSTFFKCIMPTADDTTILQLEIYLRDFYSEHNLIPDESREITGLSAKSYPRFSDFYSFLEKQIEALKLKQPEGPVEEELLKRQATTLADICDAIRNIVQNYGNMFDGYTTVDNIVDEKIVTFDISDIKDLGNIFVAQMFNMVSLCWDNAINNGTIMKERWENRELEIEDVIKFLILIDESHRWINTQMPMILDLIIKYLREARKYFAGITLASQSVRDFNPEGDNSPHVDQIRTLFELTQYKFMFKQDSSVLPLLRNVFSSSLTYSQIEQIPFLTKGETILSIAGDRSLRFSVWLSKKYEEKLFAGGR